MPIRPCLDCGTPTTTSRCTGCTRQQENNRQRPSAHARGYDTQHRAARAALALTLPALCGYGCGTTLHPGHPWVAAHLVDGDPTAGWIASCPACNERAKRRTTTRTSTDDRGTLPRGVGGRGPVDDGPR